jgi:hypothetical protein
MNRHGGNQGGQRQGQRPQQQGAAERRTPIRGEMPGRKVRADSSREAVFVLHVK